MKPKHSKEQNAVDLVVLVSLIFLKQDFMVLPWLVEGNRRCIPQNWQVMGGTFVVTDLVF